jgi:hypothetical protein
VSDRTLDLLEKTRELSNEEIHNKLERALIRPATTPVDFEALLQVSGERPTSVDWFSKRLEAIIEGVNEGWPELILYDIVYEATKIVPGKIEQFRLYWLSLIDHRAYSTLAYGALARTQTECLDFLPIWWSVNPERKLQLLKTILEELFRKQDAKDEYNNSQHRERQSLRCEIEKRMEEMAWPDDLCEEIRKFLNHGRHR